MTRYVGVRFKIEEGYGVVFPDFPGIEGYGPNIEGISDSIRRAQGTIVSRIADSQQGLPKPRFKKAYLDPAKEKEESQFPTLRERQKKYGLGESFYLEITEEDVLEATQ